MSDAIAAHQPSEVKDEAANEANNLFQSGRGDEVFPNSPFKNQFKNFKGKMFSDDIAQVEASRFLQNAKVNRVQDFMTQAEKYYGKTKEAVGAGQADGSIKPKDYTPVNTDHGEVWFPKQMAEFMEGMQSPKVDDMVQGWGKTFLDKTATAAKLLNFAYKFGSAPFNYMSNMKLAWLSKSLNPANVAKAAKIMANERMGKLGDNIVLKTPTRTFTEKELIDSANRNRAIGMGLYSPSSSYPTSRP